MLLLAERLDVFNGISIRLIEEWLDVNYPRINESQARECFFTINKWSVHRSVRARVYFVHVGHLHWLIRLGDGDQVDIRDAGEIGGAELHDVHQVGNSRAFLASKSTRGLVGRRGQRLWQIAQFHGVIIATSRGNGLNLRKEGLQSQHACEGRQVSCSLYFG